MSERWVMFPDNLWHAVYDTPKGVSPYIAVSRCGKERLTDGAFATHVIKDKECAWCRKDINDAKAKAK